LAADLTAPEVEQRILTAIDAAGGVDILVNNAGYGLFSPVEQTPESEARAVFDTNMFAPLAVLRAALPSLRKNRGRVIQLSSLLGEVPWLGSGVYSASKAAIELAIEGLALELAPLGVKVTIVASGIMATDFAATAHRVQPNETYAPTVGAFLELRSLPEGQHNFFLGAGRVPEIDAAVSEMGAWLRSKFGIASAAA
jgi:short-subunit dehydrogenase